MRCNLHSGVIVMLSFTKVYKEIKTEPDHSNSNKLQLSLFILNRICILSFAMCRIGG